MKYTIATVAAFATMALAQPAFTNTKFDLTEGKPYTITFTGCDSGCTIILQNGESTDLKDYKTLTSSAEGDSFTFTPSQLPSDTYNFKITDSAGEANYSEQFSYEGSYDAPSVTSATKTAAETTAVAETTEKATTLVTKPVDETTTAKPIIPTHVPVPPKNATTPIATPTKTGGAGETGVPEVPVSGATRMTSSLALIAGAAMAMVYLN